MSELLAAAVVFGFSLGFSQELAKDLRRWFRWYGRAHRMGPPKGSYGPAHVDWRRRFNHENTNRPSGPPPLKLRRGVYEYSPGPTTPNPDIIPQGQDPGPVRYISCGYQPLPWVQGPANPPPKEP